MRDVGVWSAACALASARLRGSRIFFVGMDLRGAAEGALRDAASEGLTLVRASDNATGFRGVYYDKTMKSKPYQARLSRGGKQERPRARSTTGTTKSRSTSARSG